MQTGSTLVRVAPNRDGGWEIREPGSTRALGHASGKDKAVYRARSMMTNGGVVQVLDVEGFLMETQSVPSPTERPWWYIQPRPVLRVIPVLLLLQGVLGIINNRDGGFGLWLYMFACLIYTSALVMVVVSLRFDRRLARSVDADGQGAR